VVSKVDRLARSLPDAQDIVDELTSCELRLNIGGSAHDSTDPVGRPRRRRLRAPAVRPNPPTDRTTGARSTPSAAASVPAAR
jgi:hypothetical protein